MLCAGNAGFQRPFDLRQETIKVCHILLQDPKFFQLLLQIDIDLAAQTRAVKCQCGGTLGDLTWRSHT
jgi:hypothetical protein